MFNVQKPNFILVSDNTVYMYFTMYDMYAYNIHFSVTILQNMVLCFRQTELQVLLGVSSESRDGRKTDLMQRALSMIDRGVSSAVESKIRDLYRKSGASTSRSSLMYSRRLATQTSSSIGTSASSRSGRM